MSKTNKTSSIYQQAVGCRFSHGGMEGVIVAFDARSYAVPMFVVRFDNGRNGALRPTEIGTR